jgi:hypothetical protein
MSKRICGGRLRLQLNRSGQRIGAFARGARLLEAKQWKH